MGLIEQELRELRQMKRDLQSGKVSNETAQTMIAIFSQTEKRARLWMQAYSLSAKYGGRMLRKMVTANMIGDGEALGGEDIDPETERIKCPGKDFELITRHEFLDFSGSQKFPECQTCEHLNITRRRILGEKS